MGILSCRNNILRLTFLFFIFKRGCLVIDGLFVVRKYRYQLNDIIRFYIMFICILFLERDMKLSFEQIIAGYNKVNMLTALREVGGVIQGKCNRRMVECLCDCGNITTISIDHYKRGKIVSCGCHQKKITSEAAKTHGLSKTAEYKVWQGMKGNPNHADYYNYGARGEHLIGVSVSDEWRNSFETFITDMGERPTATSTIERIDGTKGYSKDNCCWIEKSLQSGNRRKPCKKGTSVNYEVKRESYLKRKAA